jgi:hypothetical protein
MTMAGRRSMPWPLIMILIGPGVVIAALPVAASSAGKLK